jgi:hypothetical protein
VRVLARPRRHPLVRTTLALALTIPAVPASAAAGPPASTAAEDPALSRAKDLYTRGKGQFDTANYTAAVDLWTEAYTILPDSPDAARVKALLIYNIASAREQAYEIDRDVTHLRKARVLLQSYADAIPQLYGETSEGLEEAQKVEARIASLDEAISAAEVEASVPAPQTGDPVERPTAVFPPDDGLAPVTPAPDPVGRRMVAAGGTLVGLGGAGLAVMIAGLIIGGSANDIDDLEPDEIEARRMRFDEGRSGNVMAIAGGVIGGVFAAGGTVLIVLGRRRTRNDVAVHPAFGPGFGGVHLRARF